MKIIEKESWERKNHFQFFMKYDDPSFGITANVDITNLKKWCKQEGHSFFLASIYCSNQAANSVENFRLRIKENEIILFEKVRLGSTISRTDNLFSFAYFDMEEDIRSFCSVGQQTIEEYQKQEDFDPKGEMLDIIYYSVIPWVSFTSIKHPGNIDPGFSIPKITFGKFIELEKKLLMPVSVEANHALMDGYHIGQYFEAFQKIIDSIN